VKVSVERSKPKKRVQKEVSLAASKIVRGKEG
jgi:hypothetical protein